MFSHPTYIHSLRMEVLELINVQHKKFCFELANLIYWDYAQKSCEKFVKNQKIETEMWKFTRERRDNRRNLNKEKLINLGGRLFFGNKLRSSLELIRKKR